VFVCISLCTSWPRCVNAMSMSLTLRPGFVTTSAFSPHYSLRGQADEDGGIGKWRRDALEDLVWFCNVRRMCSSSSSSSGTKGNKATIDILDDDNGGGKGEGGCCCIIIIIQKQLQQSCDFAKTADVPGKVGGLRRRSFLRANEMQRFGERDQWTTGNTATTSVVFLQAKHSCQPLHPTDHAKDIGFETGLEPRVFIIQSGRHTSPFIR